MSLGDWTLGAREATEQLAADAATSQTNVAPIVDHELPRGPEARRTAKRTVRRASLAWLALAALAFGVAPAFGNDYWLSAILIPFLVLALAGLGLNVLTGYAGQLSLGSSAFMAVGAFGAYNALVRIPGLPLPVGLVVGGLAAAAVGVLFGLPSLRIKGFYLIVSTLAAQFFVEWAFTKFGWFSNDNASGVISAPPLRLFGHDFGDPRGRYLLTLSVVVAMTALVRNVVRGDAGRSWMAVRDMDTAAAVVGIPILRTKLSAFAVSSFICGVAGALWAFTYLGTVEPHGFDLDRSFQILFIIIIGGLGSVAGAFLGSAFIVLLPVLMDIVARHIVGGSVDPGRLENLQKIVFGGIIIVFLIKEPEGLARLVQTARRRVSEVSGGFGRR
jgi:branched-chain amino acid transport system permease protein